MITLALAPRIISAALTILALATGTRAVVLGIRASKIEPDPDWGYPGDIRLRPVIPELEQMGWTAAMLQAGKAVGQLNRRIAIWTMASVVLSALAGLTGLVI